ncbi:MAG: hypothetical protein ACON4T_07445 [Synechococcus sp.]
MNTKTTLGLLLAASSVITLHPKVKAEFLNPYPESQNNSSDLQGGYQEWTTDQDISEKAVKDESLKQAEQKVENEGACIPIGEGENCW